MYAQSVPEALVMTAGLSCMVPLKCELWCGQHDVNGGIKKRVWMKRTKARRGRGINRKERD